MSFTWEVSRDRIECFFNGHKVFSDSRDHWKNAICRLLRIDEQTARSWIERCCDHAEGSAISYQSLIKATRSQFGGVFPIGFENSKIVYADRVPRSWRPLER